MGEGISKHMAEGLRDKHAVPVDFEYHRTICSRAYENQGKPRSVWPVPGPPVNIVVLVF